MSALEMKWKIVQNLDQASDSALQEALEILLQKPVHDKKPISTNITRDMDRLIAENLEVLKRLA